MNPLTRIFIALLLLSFIAINSFAGSRSVRPVLPLSEKMNVFLNRVDSFLSASLVVPDASSLTSTPVEAENSSSRARICSCQILNLESRNYEHRHVALFAEKTNHGSSSDFSAAKKRIEREKKHLKQMFYDRVKVVGEGTATGSCQSMYIELKKADQHLQLYEILNADIR